MKKSTVFTTFIIALCVVIYSKSEQINSLFLESGFTHDDHEKPAYTRPNSEGVVLTGLSFTENEGEGKYYFYNDPPVAYAGIDQSLDDIDGNGTEVVRLSGLGSWDGDGDISQYRWTEGGRYLASGKEAAVILPVGQHTLTLSAIDNSHNEVKDSVTIKINPFSQKLEANAGLDMALVDRENDGFEEVIFDARGSRVEKGAILSYQWSAGSNILSDKALMKTRLPVGKHRLALEISGYGGKKATDNTTIVVHPAQKKIQLFNLKNKPEVDRFKRPLKRVWPSKYGDTNVCLWEDDKFAAISITIDDNVAGDHEWWINIGKKYNWKFTWFIIVNSLYETSKNPYFGSWNEFQKLADLGHDVQSHTLTHQGHDDIRGEDEMIMEYRDSLENINLNISGNNASTIAWSWGKYNRGIGGLVAIAGRGVDAVPNKPERTDYLNVNSTSTGLGKDYLDAILEGTSETSWLGDRRYLRGWLVSHYHHVKEKNKAIAEFEAVDQRRDELWIGLFSDVVRYGQERDTAKISKIANSSREVIFSLSDQMDDAHFNYPLTIKLKLYPAWSGITATQSNKPVETTIVSYGKKKYALIKIIPDRGEVVVRPSTVLH